MVYKTHKKIQTKNVLVCTGNDGLSNKASCCVYVAYVSVLHYEKNKSMFYRWGTRYTKQKNPAHKPRSNARREATDHTLEDRVSGSLSMKRLMKTESIPAT